MTEAFHRVVYFTYQSHVGSPAHVIFFFLFFIFFLKIFFYPTGRGITFLNGFYVLNSNRVTLAWFFSGNFTISSTYTHIPTLYILSSSSNHRSGSFFFARSLPTSLHNRVGVWRSHLRSFHWRYFIANEEL